MMRTTLTINDHIVHSLKRNALRSGKSFKQIVNETLERGLSSLRPVSNKAYRLDSVSMGQPRPGVDLVKALQTADELHDLEMVWELEART